MVELSGIDSIIRLLLQDDILFFVDLGEIVKTLFHVHDFVGLFSHVSVDRNHHVSLNYNETTVYFTS